MDKFLNNILHYISDETLDFKGSFRNTSINARFPCIVHTSLGKLDIHFQDNHEIKEER